MRFSDAPSWEALEALVHARRQELGWHPPDLETVRGPLYLSALLANLPCCANTRTQNMPRPSSLCFSLQRLLRARNLCTGECLIWRHSVDRWCQSKLACNSAVLSVNLPKLLSRAVTR